MLEDRSQDTAPEAAPEDVPEEEKLDEAGEAEAVAYLKASHGYRLIDVLANHSDSHVVRTECAALRAELLAPFESLKEEEN